MKVNTINLYMDSMVNGKRVGDMTFYEVYRLAYDLMVKRSCNQVVLLQKVDDAERVVMEFGRKDFE